MDQLFQKALQQAAALKKLPDSVPWTPDAPWPQTYYSWSEACKQWQASQPRTPSPNPSASHITALALR